MQYIVLMVKQKSIVKIGIASALYSVSILIGLIIGVLISGFYLLRPCLEHVGAAPAVLQRVEEVKIKSLSGSTLSGWWIPSVQPDSGTVILLHGLRGNRLSMVERARRLSIANFSVLMIDFQAHGESSGQHLTGGKLEGFDVESAVTFAHARHPNDRVAIDGVSLGAAAILLAPTSLSVDALILESVYADVDQLFHNWIYLGKQSGLLSLIEPIIVPVMKFIVLPSIGVYPGDLRPVDHVEQLTAPVLIISGSKDDITPISDAQAVFNHAPEPKSFLSFLGAGHVDLEQFDTNAYWAAVMPFLIDHLRCGNHCQTSLPGQRSASVARSIR